MRICCITKESQASTHERTLYPCQWLDPNPIASLTRGGGGTTVAWRHPPVSLGQHVSQHKHVRTTLQHIVHPNRKTENPIIPEILLALIPRLSSRCCLLGHRRPLRRLYHQKTWCTASPDTCVLPPSIERLCFSLSLVPLTSCRHHLERPYEIFALSRSSSTRPSHSSFTPALSSMMGTLTSSETQSVLGPSHLIPTLYTPSHSNSSSSKVPGLSVTTVKLVGWSTLRAMAGWEMSDIGRESTMTASLRSYPWLPTSTGLSKWVHRKLKRSKLTS